MNTIQEQNTCQLCGRHCPLNALSCPRGRAAVQQSASHEAPARREERADENALRPMEGRENHRHGHKHAHGGSRCAEDGADTHGGPGWPDGLYARFKQCGHYLFHHGKESYSQNEVLQLLLTNGESMNQLDLTQRLGVHRASASELLKKLESKQYIVRSQDEQDRRQSRVALTEAGKQALLASGTAHTTPRRDAFAALSEQEKETLSELLGKLLDSWGLSE